jgi:hypothetical protein
MDSKIILGRILQKFVDSEYSQFKNYNRFDFIQLKHESLVLRRANGNNTIIPFDKLLLAIEAYKSHPDGYEKKTTFLIDCGITHITSPIYSLLHLLPKETYRTELKLL